MIWVFYLAIAALSSAMASTPIRYVSVADYFPEIEGELWKVGWAHAVNNREKLQESLGNPQVMMLEADIIMGLHSSGEFIPVMGHPPVNKSDLSFVEFLDEVLSEVKNGARKGIKLDFKYIDAVESCLITLKAKLEESGAPVLPIIVNADILPGPVNATQAPIDGNHFIPLVIKYAPFSTLSIGWTTRFGMVDNGEDITEGKYIKSQMKLMIKTIKEQDIVKVFNHITFPVRASMAVDSIDELLMLQGHVRIKNSLTIWSHADDSVDEDKLVTLMQLYGKRNCFLDLASPSTNAAQFHNFNSVHGNDILDDSSDTRKGEERFDGRKGHEDEHTHEATSSGPNHLVSTMYIGFAAVVAIAAIFYQCM